MSKSRQQRLFAHYNPLEDRLGRTFFEELPEKPGIYKMYARTGDLLYVGKAKNLRNRLFTYRRARVGSVSRKTVRLIRMVHDIELELCGSEKEALLRENALIRRHRPEFNHAKKSPETYYFIHFREDEANWRFTLNMREKAPGSGWHTFGAFKGHTLVRTALGGILRLLHVVEHRVTSTHRLPPVLFKNLTPMDYRLPTPASEVLKTGDLRDFFTGISTTFLDTVMAYFREEGLLDQYIGKLLLEDLESVNRFYEKCCRRNNQIVEQLQLDSHIIPQHKLDDYLIEFALDEEE
ncbi:MAG: GIY-YIG nuclease family protein [Balneolaceae bacterium]|nr:GIY-YIG nuclease family protein [Balneolaceae bacterium]